MTLTNKEAFAFYLVFAIWGFFTNLFRVNDGATKAQRMLCAIRAAYCLGIIAFMGLRLSGFIETFAPQKLGGALYLNFTVLSFPLIVIAPSLSMGSVKPDPAEVETRLAVKADEIRHELRQEFHMPDPPEDNVDQELP